MPVHDSCLARGPEPELFIERLGEVVVAASDRLAHPERVFGLQRQAPGDLVELVEGDGLLGHLEGATRRLAPGVRDRRAQAGPAG